VRALLISDQQVTAGRSQHCTPYIASGRGSLAGDWPSTGGVLNITAAAWTVGFRWWRSGDITRTQNVSEYMLVLTLCLVPTAATELLTFQPNILEDADKRTCSWLSKGHGSAPSEKSSHNTTAYIQQSLARVNSDDCTVSGAYLHSHTKHTPSPVGSGSALVFINEVNVRQA